MKALSACSAHPLLLCQHRQGAAADDMWPHLTAASADLCNMHSAGGSKDIRKSICKACSQYARTADALHRSCICRGLALMQHRLSA